jgi:phage shock protein B
VWDENTTMLALVMSPVILAIAGGLLLAYRKEVLKARGASPQDQRAMQELFETARRMEQRVSYLERVLDTEAPGWRSRSDVR